MDDDESGLELSLGLGCGGSASKSKGKTVGSSDSWAEGGDKGNKLDEDATNFFHVGAQKQDSSSGSHKADTHENFFSDLSKSNADSDAGIKRKMSYEEMTNSKKHERDSTPANLREKRTSYISITDDGSTADNEDVAESEVEGSIQIPHHNDGSKRFSGFGGPSNGRNEVQLYPESTLGDLQSQKRLNGTSGTEFKPGNPNHGTPFSVQPANNQNVPFSISVRESDSVGALVSSSHPLISMIQATPNANGEQLKGIQSGNPGNLPVTFGYSHVQLPTLDKNASWVMGLHSQPVHNSHPGSIPPGFDKKGDGLKVSQVSTQVIPRNLSQSALFDARAGGDDKQQNKEDGSSSHPESDAKWTNTNVRPKDPSEQPTAENFSLDLSAIKPGIAADVKFGGCGSCPNLPWVSTTGPGPNGRTISGVPYRHSPNQVKIVCACHGSHMSPEEFIRHARHENGNPENNGVAAFPNTNPAASGPS